MSAQVEALELMVGRSLRQMVRARRPVAMVPYRLVPEGDVADPPPSCLAVRDDVDVEVAWLCLLEPDHAGDHGWPADEIRVALAGALAEQVDPLARIDRRVAFVLEELDGSMPPA